jgi:hypothetical protein
MKAVLLLYPMRLAKQFLAQVNEDALRRKKRWQGGERVV